MNILIVTQYFWPENFRINDLVLGLMEKGHAVEVLTGLPNYPDGKIFSGFGLLKRRVQTWRGVKITRVPLIPRGSGSGLRLALNYLSFAICAVLMAPLVCRSRHDVIFVYEPSPITVALPALWLRRLKGTPVVLWVQDLWPESVVATNALRSERILGLLDRLVNFIYRRCDRILTTSRAYIEPIVERGIDRNVVEYFPQSVEAIYRPAPDVDEDPVGRGFPKGFRVMFAGNIGVAQDFETILDAAELLKGRGDIHWLVFGDGRQREWVTGEVGRRGLAGSFHLFGRHPLERMPKYFASADAMLVTLRKDPLFALTIPAKVQSYMACGKPIIAALDGEGASVVEEAGAGLTCPTERPDLLAQCVLSMCEMPASSRKKMGESGLSYFNRHFDRDLLYSKVEDIMSRVARTTRTDA